MQSYYSQGTLLTMIHRANISNITSHQVAKVVIHRVKKTSSLEAGDPRLTPHT